MSHRVVDLSAHINQTVERGHPADFPVALRPVFFEEEGARHDVPHRFAVVRKDTGDALGVVSNRYALVPHQRILDLVQEAIAPLDVGPVPRGVYVDRKGARMQAIFKFPALAQPVLQADDICPCLKVRNTYDGTSRIAVHIGAFRFVCTNLAVGGGGVFAGGFMSVHAGAIRLEEVGAQLACYLKDFDAIVALYRSWAETQVSREAMLSTLDSLPVHARESISNEITRKGLSTVFEAYNAATYYATHQARSFRVGFELLARVNRGFQERFPAS